MNQPHYAQEQILLEISLLGRLISSGRVYLRKFRVDFIFEGDGWDHLQWGMDAAYALGDPIQSLDEHCSQLRRFVVQHGDLGPPCELFLSYDDVKAADQDMMIKAV